MRYLLLLVILSWGCLSVSAETLTFLFGDKDGLGTSSGQLADGTPFSPSSAVVENDDFLGTDDFFNGTANEPTFALTFPQFAPGSITSIKILMSTTNMADFGPSGSGLFTNDFVTLDGVDVTGALDGINQDSPDVIGTIVLDSNITSPSTNVHSGNFPLAPSFFSLFEDGEVDMRFELSSNDGLGVDFVEVTIDGTLASTVPEMNSLLLLLFSGGLFFWQRRKK